MIDLEIIGGSLTSPHHIGINRIKHLTEELKRLNVNVTFHELPPTTKITGIKLLKRIRMRKALYQQIVRETFDKSTDNTIFFVSSPPTIFAPILKPISKKYKTILDLRDIYNEWEYHPFLKRKFEKWEQNSTIKKVNAVTYVHEGFRSYFLQDKIDINKTHFITNGANDQIFTYKGKTKRLSEAQMNLIYAGGIAHYHKVPQWLDIMRELKNNDADVHLTIIGAGYDSQIIDSKIKQYNLKNVTFKKTKMSQVDLASYIRGADYAIASSNSKCQVFHNVVIMTKVYEALCCGIPVLSNAGTSMDKFNKSFPLCKNWDPNTGFNSRNISLEIESLPVLTEQERKRLAIKAHSKFSFTVIAQKFKEILDSLVN